MSKKTFLLSSLVILVTLGAAGCANEARYLTPERYDWGLVLILTGIEGKSVFNTNIRKGLERHGVPYAIEIYDWTTGIPALFLLHLMDYEKSRSRAAEIAARLRNYREKYPGRPVWLVGISSGGGMLVFALEALPEGFKAESAFLIAPTMGPEYNLTKALAHCRKGMVNYYSGRDMFFSGVGTCVFGTLDRVHGSAAARFGFKKPQGLTAEGVRLYENRLEQIDCSRPGSTPGHPGFHLTSASVAFVEKAIGPLIWWPEDAAGATGNKDRRGEIEAKSEK